MQPRRDIQKKIQPEYHLIVTEGTETEPAYFKSIKEIINRQYKDKINLEIHGEGTNTLQLLEKAKTRARNNPNLYRHVWIVYDTDDFPAEHIDKTADLCHEYTTDETEYHAIWSNQCIELWFLLHFSYLHSDLNRREYWPKLTDRLESIGEGKYTKGRTDMYHVLCPYIDIAIANAKKLAEINEGRPPSKSAPGTKIYELIEKLKPYL